MENSNGALLQTYNLDYGAKFLWEVAALIRRRKNDADTIQRVHDSFLLETVQQVCKRLPSSKKIFDGLSYMHPTRVFNQVGRVSLNDLPMQHLIGEYITEIDCEYRNVMHVD